MHNRITIALLALILAGMGCAADKELLEKAKSVFAPIPNQMPGAESDKPELVSLGEKLYFETALSANNTQSCNSCHMVNDNKAGVDNEATSKGAGGKRGGRNAPTVLNAGFHLAQFWDGRAKDLQEQAKGPILNPIEMGMPNAAAVVKKLKGMKEYPALFQKAFPGEKDPLTYENLAKAIAAFERTLVTHDRFDDFLKGQTGALTAAEKKGLALFMDTGCSGCHDGPLVGGNKYQKIGLVNEFKTEDTGRFQVTKDGGDKFFFKVPSLRNVALTGPYFHDGSVSTLEQAIKLMGHHQLGKELTDEEIQSIASFLRSLSDKVRK